MAFKPHLFKYLKASEECSPHYLLPLLLLINVLCLLDAFHSEVSLQEACSGYG